MKLTKENSKVFKSEKGNLYINHPQFKQVLRLYADEEELRNDPSWRDRVALREGEGFYCVLAKHALEELEV